MIIFPFISSKSIEILNGETILLNPEIDKVEYNFIVPKDSIYSKPIILLKMQLK